MFYKSQRIGRKGKPFFLYKFKTLKDGADKSQFASDDNYLPFGKFLRKTHLDELPQIWNLIKRDMDIVGPRPEERRTIEVIPKKIRKNILKVRPGLTSLASLYFFDEEQILKYSSDPHKTYWTKIKPIKIILDSFYVQNKSWMLDCYIIWATAWRILKSLWT